MASSHDFLPYLYSALASEFGICLSVSDAPQAKAVLYKARKESQDPDLSCISIHSSPFSPDSEIWLVKRRKKDTTNAPKGK